MAQIPHRVQRVQQLVACHDDPTGHRREAPQPLQGSESAVAAYAEVVAPWRLSLDTLELIQTDQRLEAAVRGDEQGADTRQLIQSRQGGETGVDGDLEGSLDLL